MVGVGCTRVGEGVGGIGVAVTGAGVGDTRTGVGDVLVGATAAIVVGVVVAGDVVSEGFPGSLPINRVPVITSATTTTVAPAA